MYPFERFTERAKNVLTLAQKEAEQSGVSYVGTEHLLIGLMLEREGLAATALRSLSVELDDVRRTIESVLRGNQRVIVQQIIPTSRVKKVIEISFEEAQRMGHGYAGTEHILLGLLVEGEGIAAHVLEDLGANLDRVRPEIERLLHDEPGAHTPPAVSHTAEHEALSRLALLLRRFRAPLQAPEQVLDLLDRISRSRDVRERSGLHHELSPLLDAWKRDLDSGA